MYTLKKSLGQHFLKDEGVVDRIMEELMKRPFSRLLEVGPGAGALTRRLVNLPGVDFRAVEVDAEKVDYLRRTFPVLQERLIHADFLSIPLPFSDPFVVIGNFPYNISSQILFRILEWKDHVPAMIGMFQKEVAERAAAREGSRIYGVLSVLLQYYYQPEFLFSVSNESFIPPPRVQSGVIRLTRKETLFPVKSQRYFTTLVKTAFGQRRKTLRNAVKSLFGPEHLAERMFDRRAETLSVEEFAQLTFNML